MWYEFSNWTRFCIICTSRTGCLLSSKHYKYGHSRSAAASCNLKSGSVLFLLQPPTTYTGVEIFLTLNAQYNIPSYLSFIVSYIYPAGIFILWWNVDSSNYLFSTKYSVEKISKVCFHLAPIIFFLMPNLNLIESFTRRATHSSIHHTTYNTFHEWIEHLDDLQQVNLLNLSHLQANFRTFYYNWLYYPLLKP